MKFHVLTLFPDMVMAGLNDSIIKRAMDQKLISIDAVNIRDFSEDKHKRVDDYTYGGGAGMLMQAEVVYQAIKATATPKSRVIYVTPQGKPFSQKMAEEFAREEDLVLLCGHYEGIHERVLEECVTDYVSIGDYVLTGGELASMVMIDAIARLVPGVLHNEVSAETESFQGKLLEYPQYSRPEVWHKKAVPEVLLTGNSKKIREWRLEQSIARTKERRPDLYKEYEQLEAVKKQLSKHKIHHMDMIEMINRGRAELIFADETEALLQEKVSCTYFHTLYEDAGVVELTGTNENQVTYRPHFLDALSSEELSKIHLLMEHRSCCVEEITQALGLHIDYQNHTCALTRREKLPIKGLYSGDGKPNSAGIEIVPLTLEHLDYAKSLYHLNFDDPDYIEHRIERDPMYLALYEGQPAGIIGMHVDGSIGMLEVEPKFRRKHIGFALETYFYNKMLEAGQIPYGYIFYTNQISIDMQEKLGMYVAKEDSFWLHK